MSRVQQPEISADAYETDLACAIADLGSNRVLARIWACDHTVWKPDPREIENRLGWLKIAPTMAEDLPRLKRLGHDVWSAGYTDVLLLGMGGSSLAPEVFRKAFGAIPRHPNLEVLDSTDPMAVHAYAKRLNPAQTLFIVSTKSGGTVETLSYFKYFYNWAEAALTAEAASRHFVAITDPDTALVGIADRYSFRDTFVNDPTIGGRYSALSFFGLVPATLIGVDVSRLLERAKAAMRRSGAEVVTPDNPAARLGAALGELAKRGRDKATFIISPAIEGFGDWLEQLIAESTGKEGRGIVPIVGEPVGPPECYGSDRLFIHVRLDGDETYDEAVAALQKAGHPVIRLRLGDLYDLGDQMFLWELAVAVAGQRLGINPFDQPNVEAAKAQARGLVAEYTASGSLPADDRSPLDRAELDRFLEQGKPGDYVALQVYVRPTQGTTKALGALRRQIRDRTQMATTAGYGPRYLHSTGQLHKGGAGNGLFVQLTAHHGIDVPIPDEAGKPISSITFGVLKAAQALGDRRALVDSGRRVIHFDLGSDVISGLSALGVGQP